MLFYSTRKNHIKFFNITQKSGKIRKIIAPDEKFKIKTRLRETNLVFQKMYDHINEDFQVAYKVGKEKMLKQTQLFM